MHFLYPIMRFAVLSRNTVLVACLFIVLNADGQTNGWSASLDSNDANYGVDRYHDILRYHDPIMYIAFPVIKPVLERSLPLDEGEGKNGYWLEGNFAYRFVIYKGKYYSLPFFQRVRFTFDVGLTSRLTRDDSSPLLPFNNKFGFGLDFLLSGLDQLKQDKATLVWATAQVHHYSNGQSDTFFVDNPIRRNNYLSGDFSTNYYRLMLNVAVNVREKNIVQGVLGYQADFDPGGPLTRSKELSRFYGDQRILFSFQITKKPQRVINTYVNKSTGRGDSVKVEVRRQLSFRTELEYILGDVSLFIGSGNNKYRLGWHNYLTYMPSVTNEVGFLLHTYWGRDYLNIRFDDVVFAGEAGLFIKFNSR